MRNEKRGIHSNFLALNLTENAPSEEKIHYQFLFKEKVLSLVGNDEFG